MRILLTGTSGQVGHELLHALRTSGDIIAVDRATMDLTNLAQVQEVIREVRPALIVHPAAYTAVDLAEREVELAMRTNAEAPAVMAAEAKRLGAALIYYSTDYVFDGCKTAAYVEEDTARPQNIYGQSKLAGEQAIIASGVPHLILRTSWVYGWHGRNFLLTVRKLAQERQELRIVADQLGAPTWARTLAVATAAAVQSLQKTASDGVDLELWQERGGLYHLTAQGSTSWYGFAQAIVDQLRLDIKPDLIPVATEAYPLLARRPANSVLSSEKFMRTFGSLPDWNAALQTCLSEA